MRGQAWTLESKGKVHVPIQCMAINMEMPIIRKLEHGGCWTRGRLEGGAKGERNEIDNIIDYHVLDLAANQ